jgi:hypothetical protein
MSDLICKYCKHKIIKNRCEYCGAIYTAEKGKEEIVKEEIKEEIKEEKLLTEKQSAILFYLITAATLIMIIIWSYIFI